MTQQELNERTKKRPLHSVFGATEPMSPAFCLCTQIVEPKRQNRKRKWEDGADLPVVHYQLLFPPHHLCLSTISSNWILHSDVLSPISSLCFTWTIVLFPSPFSASTAPWSSGFPTSDKISISVLCPLDISPLVGGCFIYQAWDTCSDSLTERLHTAHYSSCRSKVRGLQLADRKQLGCWELCVCTH